MANGVRIEKLTRQGIAIMQEERELALKGDLSGLEKLNARKVAFLSEMETLADSKAGRGVSPAQRAELETLFDIIKRRAVENQSLLRAAAAGVQAAQRRIAMMHSSDGDLGIYGRDGHPIKNNNGLNSNSQIA
ncbi:MAG: hypothetical protein MRY74_06980 [Neomegalonema sp.]|nr:hypothetical protein [Neomegalonema sp.]